MRNRKWLIGAFAAAAASLAFGASTMNASADPRTFVVTLLGGKTVTLTVDVPADTPVDQIKFPGVELPLIVSVQEVTAQAPAEQPGQQAPLAPAPGTEGGAPADTPGVGATEEKQRTTGRTRREAQGGGAVEQLVTETEAVRRRAGRLREADGQPTLDNPTISLASPGPAPIGVPNFFIEKFKIPPFLLPIYQAAGIEYGIRWEILAAINEIETDYGRNLNVSTAGAVGWMQFMPSSWKAYGVDANRDGRKDPYNPVDAIFAAARYLRAADAEKDLRKAIFAYNHADWYVDSVLMRAQLIAGMPADLVGSLSGLTQGHFPVHATARYADDLRESDAKRRIKRGENAAIPVEANPSRRGINIYAKRGAPVVATQDGKVVRVGRTERLGRFVQLRDAYGNTYTYGHLKSIAATYPSPRKRQISKEEVARELKLPRRDAAPSAPASKGEQGPATGAADRVAETVRSTKERLFANPGRPSALENGGDEQLLDQELPIPGYSTYRSYFSRVFGLDRDEFVLKRLRPGARVVAGTVLGRIGKTSEKVAPHVLFEIRPAGRGAPRIDPKPILDGWKLLESTAIYRAAGKNPFFGPEARKVSIGQILLMSKEALERRVLADPRIDIYGCGRRDIRAGAIDRRVLATLSFLSASGLRPTVTSLTCGHSYYTKGGSVSHHSSGNAVDIAKINGIPIMGHQGEGSVTDLTVQRLLTLQGTMKPAQIITLMQYEGTDNTYAMSDHADHIHVGFRPHFDPSSKEAKRLNAVLRPKQWIKLIDRLSEIDNPRVPVQPSKYSIKIRRSGK